jgi:dTDP-4-dehydrorhamnose reductase
MSTDINSMVYKPELWAGMECTINRVGDRFFDQLSHGHYARDGDLQRLADLNIKALRYPVLWEHYQPEQNTAIDWTRARKDILFLKEKGIKPIVGLLHHGSGPKFTDLLDPQFPEKLSAYAHAVATQFPDVDHYTPVNEPLTTARFSALYGHWYPHRADSFNFAKALLHQVKGVVLAMQAIRQINPHAKLIQTEDLGKTHSTPLLQYQADFENERRWITFDLLCGKLDEKHPLWDWLINLGISDGELYFFVENACPPDIVGLNYYATSERFLDENVAAYPFLKPGGNGRHEYIDTEAVRKSKASGLRALLRETFERFQLPMALTEVHLGCTREEQMRWLNDAWLAVNEASASGMPVRALTVWSTFGAYDWNSLLTVQANHYECGAFDVSHGVRETALAKMVKSLGDTGEFDHPLIKRSGWWKDECENERCHHLLPGETPLLIIGKGGTLAAAFARICRWRNIGYVALSRSECDITNEEQLLQAIDKFKPWAIINTAGYVNVDQAEVDKDLCYQLNAIGPSISARICREKGIRFMTFSSDLVFSGDKTDPYHERDRIDPLNIYGRSKAHAEQNVSRIDPSALIIRTSAFFGPWDQYNFAYSVMNALKNNQEHDVAHDVIISPTYVPHLVQSAMDLFIDEASGIWHLANDGYLSWADFATEIANRKGFKRTALRRKTAAEMNWRAPRPRYSALTTTRGMKLPTLDRALSEYINETNF